MFPARGLLHDACETTLDTRRCPMNRNAFVLAAGLALTLAAPAGAAHRDATSYRYAYSTFREDAGRVSVFVDGYPATQRATDRYVPIPIVVASVAGGRPIP